MYFYAVLSSFPFSRRTDDLEEEESAGKQATAMIDELQSKGMMQAIITQAGVEADKMDSDFGRGGARGFKAFVSLTNEINDDQPGASFRKSVNARINAAEKVASALEQELTRRFPEHLRWNRMGGPSIKTMANRVTYVTGEILRQFEKPV